jgi:hypothetical protein
MRKSKLRVYIAAMLSLEVFLTAGATDLKRGEGARDAALCSHNNLVAWRTVAFNDIDGSRLR